MLTFRSQVESDGMAIHCLAETLELSRRAVTTELGSMIQTGLVDSPSIRWLASSVCFSF